MTPKRYLIVTPCRNEAAFAKRTLDSVIAQSHLPSAWIIVDDGSTDNTPEILADYASRNEFIEIITRPDRGHRHVGGGVIDAFLEGLSHVDLSQFDFLCKLDLDLDMPLHYFEALIQRMEDDPRLGTCSGKAYYEDMNGHLIKESIGDEVSVGASKFFRTECYQQIGGFEREIMWDGIDCHKARMRGWKVRSWNDPELRFLHLRPMGSSHRSIYHGRMRHGRGQYYMGSAWYYMLASAIFRILKRPIILGSFSMMWGYWGAALRGMPRFPDPEFRKFLRKYQRLALRIGKGEAARRIEIERSGELRQPRH